jgi:hypothetical protein
MWPCNGQGAEVPFAAAEVVNSGPQGNQFRWLSGIHFGQCTLDGVISDGQQAHHHRARSASVRISTFRNARRQFNHFLILSFFSAGMRNG